MLQALYGSMLRAIHGAAQFRQPRVLNIGSAKYRWDNANLRQQFLARGAVR